MSFGDVKWWFLNRGCLSTQVVLSTGSILFLSLSATWRQFGTGNLPRQDNQNKVVFTPLASDTWVPVHSGLTLKVLHF